MRKTDKHLRRVRSKYKLILALLSILLPASFLAIQEVQEFTVRVTDPKGAVVPNATVIAQNLDTRVSTSTTTSVGDYTIPYVIPGHYSVTVEARGFETAVRTGLVSQVDQIATVDFAPKVGVATETVTVNADALLDNPKADNGEVVENTRMTELPLDGGDPGMLSILAPAPTGPNPFSGSAHSTMRR
jgi:hypothetical protein